MSKQFTTLKKRLRENANLILRGNWFGAGVEKSIRRQLA